MASMMSRVLSCLLLGLVLAAGGAGYALYTVFGTGGTVEVTRQRLAALEGEHETLRERYNQVVRRTAVTELRVEPDHVQVVVRRVDGATQVIDTPYRPDRELYVDYAVIGGRVWIRRLFDDQTPPNRGTLIDSSLCDIDWERDDAAVGKAVYRRLTPGRWVVSVTGDGSLGLTRVTGGIERGREPGGRAAGRGVRAGGAGGVIPEKSRRRPLKRPSRGTGRSPG